MKNAATGSDQYTIRQYSTQDKEDVRRICWQTGYMGKSMDDTTKFTDKKLFWMIFCDYYLDYEPEHCFVVTNHRRQVIGYIIGTDNTDQQVKYYKKTMFPKIILRIFAITWWRYPRSFYRLMCFIRNAEDPREYSEIIDRSPAHFHINFIPGYQGLGLGTRLLRHFEDHMMKLVEGIHMSTSSKNTGAIKFYTKLGYEEVHRCNRDLWDVDTDHVMMEKSIGDQQGQNYHE